MIVCELTLAIVTNWVKSRCHWRRTTITKVSLEEDYYNEFDEIYVVVS
jgi:hypothetical protein